MKLYYKNSGNNSVNINGTVLKFENSVVEVSNEFGTEALSLGISNLFEEGTQPTFFTPKEVQLKTDFADRENWYKKEISRIMNINECQKIKISELESESKLWRTEFENKSKHFKEYVNGVAPKAVEPIVVTEVTVEAAGKDLEGITHKDIECELSNMTKAEIVEFGNESGIDMTDVKNETKAKMIEFIVNSLK